MFSNNILKIIPETNEIQTKSYRVFCWWCFVLGVFQDFRYTAIFLLPFLSLMVFSGQRFCLNSSFYFLNQLYYLASVFSYAIQKHVYPIENLQADLQLVSGKPKGLKVDYHRKIKLFHCLFCKISYVLCTSQIPQFYTEVKEMRIL